MSGAGGGRTDRRWWVFTVGLVCLALVTGGGVLTARAAEHSAFALLTPQQAPPSTTSAATTGAPSPAVGASGTTSAATPSTTQAAPTTAAPATAAPPTVAAPPRVPPAGQHPFATAVSADHRYLVDQYGAPFLVRGDSPWALLTDVSPAQATTYFTTRARQGFNSAIMSLLGATENGAPYDDGRTFDGIAPFVGGDVTSWNEPYWQRAHAYLKAAYDAGITVFLYPIDGWAPGHSFNPSSSQQCRVYGRMVGQRFADLPNIAWMVGGDYFPKTNDLAQGSDLDHCMDAMLQGLRDAGLTPLVSIQLGYQRSASTDNPFWAPRVDWNFVYTYYPSYPAVRDAFAVSPTMPAILGETYYEGEVSGSGGTTQADGVRRQVLWALTSGASGDFFGTADWRFNPGWEGRLDSAGARQVNVVRTAFASLRWWQLQPDTRHPLVTSDRGTYFQGDQRIDVMTNDYVTAASTPDGQQAVVYVPSQPSVTVDLGALAPGRRATWVDPASGAVHPAGAGPRFVTPGRNSAGGQDWLLVLQ